MSRARVLVPMAVLLAIGLIIVLARWAPGALQPAGARAELSRLIVNAANRLDATIGAPDDSDPQPLATLTDAAPAVAEDPWPVRPISANHAGFCLAPLESTTLGDAEGRLCVVVFKTGKSWRTETTWPRRELLSGS